jgi:hypothetical protein
LCREAATQSRLKVKLLHQAADLLVVDDQALLAKRSLRSAKAAREQLMILKSPGVQYRRGFF